MNPELEFLLSIGTFLGSIATIVVAGLIWKQSRQTQTALEHTEKAQFATVLRDLFHEHSELLREETSLEKEKWKDSLDACEIYALTYCDFMSQVAYLALKKKISPDIARQFKEYFEYVYLVMTWYDKVIQTIQSERTLRSSKERWPLIDKWAGELEDFHKDEEKNYLPSTMMAFWDWAEKNPDELKNAMKNPADEKYQEKYKEIKNNNAEKGT